MLLSVGKSTFLKALGHCYGVVEKKTTIPVLSHVLLEAKGGFLHVTATDMDMVMAVSINASITTEGSVCVSASLLHDIVKKFPEKNSIDIELDLERLKMSLKSGRSLFTLNGLNNEDFPLITKTDLEYSFKINSKKLLYLIDHSKFAMDNSEVRYNLGGIFMHLKTENNNTKCIRAVATDMHRLACVGIEAPANLSDIPSVTIGRKTIFEIRKLIADIDTDLLFSLSKNRLEINLSSPDGRNILFSSRLIEGNFPDYEDSIIIEDQDYFIVNKKEFLEAADRVATVVGSKERAIKLSLDGNNGKMMPVASEIGDAIEDFDIEYPKGNKFDVCFNVDYIMDILREITTEEVIIYTTGKDGQFLIKPTDENLKEVYLLMPLID